MLQEPIMQKIRATHLIARVVTCLPRGLLAFMPWEARDVALRGIARGGVHQNFLTDIVQKAGISFLGVDGSLAGSKAPRLIALSSWSMLCTAITAWPRGICLLAV
jgi:hypothetical protein